MRPDATFLARAAALGQAKPAALRHFVWIEARRSRSGVAASSKPDGSAREDAGPALLAEEANEIMNQIVNNFLGFGNFR